MEKLKNISTPKRLALAFLLGAVMTLAMPPLGIFPVLLVSIPGFILLSYGAPSRGKSFLTGWAFGAGYFIFGLYWVSAALFVDIDAWGWVLPLSLVLAPTMVGLCYGFVPLLARYKGEIVPYTLDFIALFTAVEWLRGHLFTGFPWNLPGYAFMHVLPVMQSASVFGVYGLTLMTLLWAALPLLTPEKRVRHAVLASFIAVLLLGSLRLSAHPTEPTDKTVRIVQANIPQTAKWNSDEEWRNLEKHAILSDRAKPADAVIWPETAVTADLTMFPDIGRYIGLKLPEGSLGILGALRVTENPGKPNSFFNSVSVLDGKSHVLASYDKHHLVPFGEYIPWREKLNLTPIAVAISGIGDFTPGKGPATLKAGGLPPFSPLICYEVIFPHEVADEKNRPAWLVNVTNDGWYGRTAGPHQHFEIARLRAVEEGLPLARAANTGISGMIDPLGRIIAEQPLGTEGAIDAPLPKALPQTLYARFGDTLFFIMLFLVMSLGTALHRRKS